MNQVWLEAPTRRKPRVISIPLPFNEPLCDLYVCTHPD